MMAYLYFVFFANIKADIQRTQNWIIQHICWENNCLLLTEDVSAKFGYFLHTDIRHAHKSGRLQILSPFYL
jgi:hypothetical protein